MCADAWDVVPLACLKCGSITDDIARGEKDDFEVDKSATFETLTAHLICIIVISPIIPYPYLFPNSYIELESIVKLLTYVM